MYLLIFIIIVLATLGIIYMLHKRELLSRQDSIDRTAPLGKVDLEFNLQPPAPVQQTLTDGQNEFLPSTENADTGAAAIAVTVATDEENHDKSDTWADKVKVLRDADNIEAALQLCAQHFPRIQAFQLAAVILRQQVREHIDSHKPATDQLARLYRIAVMADLYRNSNPHKPQKPAKALNALQDLQFEYSSIGTRHLRLLSKSDIKHLEQLWGRPKSHQHAEIALGESWQALCQA